MKTNEKKNFDRSFRVLDDYDDDDDITAFLKLIDKRENRRNRVPMIPHQDIENSFRIDDEINVFSFCPTHSIAFFTFY